MYQLKAFLSINSLVDNHLGKDSVIGELSSNARSYSREIGYYTNESYPDVRLATFSSYEDGKNLPLTNTLAKPVLQLGDWLKKEALIHRISDDKKAFIQKVTAEYLGRIKLIEVGKMITDGKYYMPEYIKFQLLADNRDNIYTIWFCGESFENQYDDFEIDVIPQLLEVDDFHKEEGEVKRLLAENTVDKLHIRVNARANEKPYTHIFSYMYTWYNKHDLTDTVPTYWTVIIYGNAGNNHDLIRDAIADYVLENSEYDRDEWEVILPDLFIPTEFYLSPVWTKFATENLQLKGGIYSPLITQRDILPWCKRTMHGFEDEHIQNYSVVFNSIYKSISVMACGNPKNRLAPVEFEKAWPDYANIYTTSLDFNRLSPKTQEFIMMMNEMMLEAETMTPDSDVPPLMTRIQRGDMYYLVKTLDGVTYLMPLRFNFLYEISEQNANASIELPAVAGNPHTEESHRRVNTIIDMTPKIDG